MLQRKEKRYFNFLDLLDVTAIPSEHNIYTILSTREDRRLFYVSEGSDKFGDYVPIVLVIGNCSREVESLRYGPTMLNAISIHPEALQNLAILY